MYPSVTINNKAAEKIASGYPWVNKQELIGRKPTMPGIVNIIDKRGKFLGMAFCSPESAQFLRIFIFNARSKISFPLVGEGRGEGINKEFWRERILAAYKRRQELLKTTDAVRVVYSESDGIPSAMIDKYNDIFSIQITSSGAETIKKDLFDIIKEGFKPKNILMQIPPIPPLIKGGGGDYETIIHEADQKFFINLSTGQKTGAYLDYRAIRLKAKEFAKGSCLDAFSYEGHFSCQIASEAEKVLTVDSSANAIEMAKKNADLNGHKNITCVKADVFDFLKDCSEKFDFIHLDPPSFVKSHAGIPSAIRGYKKLVDLAMKHLNKGGIILLSSCSHNISERLLESCLPKDAKIIWRGIQDKDHPLLKGFPESLYLKSVGFSV